MKDYRIRQISFFFFFSILLHTRHCFWIKFIIFKFSPNNCLFLHFLATFFSHIFFYNKSNNLTVFLFQGFPFLITYQLCSSNKSFSNWKPLIRLSFFHTSIHDYNNSKIYLIKHNVKFSILFCFDFFFLKHGLHETPCLRPSKTACLINFHIYRWTNRSTNTNTNTSIKIKAF